MTQPFLKWAGGKRNLVPQLKTYFETTGGTFYEPFVGAGAMTLAMVGGVSRVAGDLNNELINTYQQVRDNVDEVVRALSVHKNEQSHFLNVRAWDRDPDFFQNLGLPERAARMIYLNKTCYNGLYRVNRRGEFNVPFGRMPNVDIVSEATLRLASENLNGSESGLGGKVRFECTDFIALTQDAEEGDSVYFDPPYDPISQTSSFVSYSSSGFNAAEQERLRDEAVRLTEKGVRVVVSNSNTELIRGLYSSKHFRLGELMVRRSVAAQSRSRKDARELIVSNLDFLGVELNK